MPELSETILIDRCKRREHGAFDTLVRLYEKRVYNLAYRLSGNYDDASEISVDVFTRVYQALHLFRGDANFSTWVFRIVMNVYLDRRKRMKNKTHISLEQTLEIDETNVARQVQDPGPSPSDIAEGHERTAILAAAIAELPEYQRALVVLYHTEGLAYDEIAEILQLPLGTVKSRMNRARIALREKLRGRTELF